MKQKADKIDWLALATLALFSAHMFLALPIAIVIKLN